MGQALASADVVVVTDVYVAREDPDPAVTGALVAGAVHCRSSACTMCPTSPTWPRRSPRCLRPGDLVLTLGAGNITDVAPQLLELLAAGAGR
jgi:UDP-N-acetylmuramate--alanine ligase